MENEHFMKRGKYLEDGVYRYTCRECDGRVAIQDIVCEFKYCPFCGYTESADERELAFRKIVEKMREFSVSHIKEHFVYADLRGNLLDCLFDKEFLRKHFKELDSFAEGFVDAVLLGVEVDIHEIIEKMDAKQKERDLFISKKRISDAIDRLIEEGFLNIPKVSP